MAGKKVDAKDLVEAVDLSKININDVEDVEDDEDDDTPVCVIRRIAALSALQESGDSIDAEYKAERLALEAKYRALKIPLADKRHQIISGLVEAEPLADEEPAATSEDEEGDAVKGIPGFWLQSLVSHPAIGDFIQQDDTMALAALTDIRVSYNEDMTSFTLNFLFEENDYFENKELTKTYCVDPDLITEQSPTLTSIDGCTIEWKDGQNLCAEEIQKKQRSKSGKKKGQVRTVSTLVPKPSFFHFFSEPEDDEADEEDEDDGKEQIKLNIEEDYELGHALRTSVIPNAILWFTGEAMEDDEEYDEDDDDVDDDDDDDDDEDDSGDEEVTGKKGKGHKVVAKAGGGFAAPSSSGALQPPSGTGDDGKPECKQS